MPRHGGRRGRGGGHSGRGYGGREYGGGRGLSECYTCTLPGHHQGDCPLQHQPHIIAMIHRLKQGNQLETMLPALTACSRRTASLRIRLRYRPWQRLSSCPAYTSTVCTTAGFTGCHGRRQFVGAAPAAGPIAACGTPQRVGCATTPTSHFRISHTRGTAQPAGGATAKCYTNPSDSFVLPSQVLHLPTRLSLCQVLLQPIRPSLRHVLRQPTKEVQDLRMRMSKIEGAAAPPRGECWRF